MNTDTLKFSAIYGLIERDPPSGSAPEDWLAAAKKTFKTKKKQSFMFFSTWNVLQYAPKWTNSGVVIPTATSNLLLSSSHQPTSKHAERPIGQKQAKKRRCEAVKEANDKDKKAIIDPAQELAAQLVLCQGKSNALSEKMIKLETCLCASKLVMNELKLLGRDELSCPNEEIKLILRAMKKGLEERWI